MTILTLFINIIIFEGSILLAKLKLIPILKYLLFIFELKFSELIYDFKFNVVYFFKFHFSF